MARFPDPAVDEMQAGNAMTGAFCIPSPLRDVDGKDSSHASLDIGTLVMLCMADRIESSNSFTLNF